MVFPLYGTEKPASGEKMEMALEAFKDLREVLWTLGYGFGLNQDTHAWAQRASDLRRVTFPPLR